MAGLAVLEVDVDFSEVLERIPVVERPVTRNDDRTIRAITESLEPRLADWAISVASQAIIETHRTVSPARFADVADAIAQSIESISINLIKYIAAGRAVASAVRISKAQRATSVQAARIGIPLASVVGGLRRLELRWKTTFFELVIGAFPADRALMLVTELESAISTYFSTLIDEDARIWNDEQSRLLEQRIASQRQVVERIAAGKQVDDAVVASALGIEPGGWHLGLVVSVQPGEELDFASLRLGLERAFPHHRVTFIPIDHDIVWAFITGAPVDDFRSRIDPLAAPGTGALVAVGLPAAGVAGLRSTLLTAQSAHSLGRLSPSAGPVVDFAVSGFVSLAVRDRELAGWFVESEIGALLDGGPGTDDLMLTLETLYAHGGSLMRTAETLYVHRNTVAYRLKRLEDLLGRDPLARPVETQAALMLWRALRA